MPGQIGQNVGGRGVVQMYADRETRLDAEAEQHSRLATGRGCPAGLDDQAVVDQPAYDDGHGGCIQTRAPRKSSATDLSGCPDPIEQQRAMGGQRRAG